MPSPRVIVSILIAFVVATTPSAVRAARIVEEVGIQSGGMRLAGTIYLPASPESMRPLSERSPDTRFPAVVMLNGSGTMDRTTSIYREQAAWLADLGLVVLDFDRPGIGGSAGTYEENPDLTIEAGHALAALAFLRRRSEVDSTRVGIWGISQGGWVGQIVAADEPRLAFAILVSAPGVSPLDQMLYQRGIELLEDGWTPRDVEALAPLRRQLWRYYRTGEGRSDLEKAWTLAEGEAWFAKLNWPSVPPGREQLNDSQRSFYGAHSGYEPEPMLCRIRIPVLFLFGGKDRHIPVAESVRVTREATSNNPLVEVDLFPNAGHLLQAVEREGECLKCEHEADESGRLPDLTPIPEARDRTRAWLIDRLHDVSVPPGR